MWNRRELLRVGSAGAVGLTLPRWLAADARRRSPTAAATPPSTAAADALIVIYLNGGPSHLDLWDMKPQAPPEIRGEFLPIASSLPGLSVSEHLPRTARQMHLGTLVRSMQHSVNNSHAAAVYAALTGHDRGEQGGGAKGSDHPAPGAVLAKLQPSNKASLPYVALPYKTQEGAGGPLQPGFLAGFLGAAYDPFWIVEDPNAPQFQVQNLALADGLSADRFSSRSQLLSGLAQRSSTNWPRLREPQLDALDSFQQQAFDLLTTPIVREAFQLERVAADHRERYGRNIYGQSLLLARRLIDAGTRVVTMSWAPDANATWDTHGGNFRKLKETLLPQFDLGCSALLQDLLDSGRLERTIVAVLGDFGRTPKINGGAGRDHWNNCYSVLLFGGGFRAGFVYGASDRTGSVPIENPVSPGDIIATLYRQLGVDPQTTIYDALERPHPVAANGRIIEALLS